MQRLVWLLIGTLCLVGLTRARADVVVTNDGAKYRGEIIKETSRAVTIKTRVGKVKISRDDISHIVREAELKADFKKRFESAKRDADKSYKLGKWAKREGLGDEARQAFERAVELDGYHEKAREALGHRQHQGRWYTPEAYRKDVLGLVLYKGKWIKPEDKEKLDQGFVRTKDGKWILPEGRDPKPARPRPARPKPPTSTGAKPKPSKPSVRPNPGKKAPERKAEDTSWYRDNTAVSSFADAAKTESRFYTIRTNVKPEYAKRYGGMMDRYYVRFQKVFKEFLPRGGNQRKSEIWIYASREEFRRAERVGPTTGGFYNTGTKRVTAFHGPFGNTGTTREVLAHEGTHQFQDLCLGGRFGNAPIWILEGLAVLFESAYYDGKEVVIGLVPRDRLQSLKRGLASNTLIPLTQLIRTPQQSFTAYHYAHAWGLIYMILYYGESKTVRQRCQQWFSDLFSAAKTGRVTAETVEERIGGREKFLELEQRWKDWIRDLPYDYDPR